MSKLKIGFIGLGLMGRPMALNILKSGYPLSVYNRSPEKTKEFSKLGVKVYDSPAELAENCDVVITMVTGPKDVRKVLFGRNGVVEGANDNLIVIDMSTIGPTAVEEIAEDLKVFRIDFLDAPVTGSTNRAIDGTLTILVGGDIRVYDRIKLCLQAMGKDVFYLGKTGSGQAMKLVNNLMGGITVAALAEGMMLADSLGVKRSEVLRVLSDAPLISPNMKMKMPLMVNEKYPVAFSVANMRKDLNLALLESSRKSQESGKKTSMPLLKNTEKLLRKGMKMGLSDQDYSAVLEVLEKSS